LARNKKKSSLCGEDFFIGRSKKLDGFDVSGLQTLGAFFDGKFHLLAFLEVAETVSLNGREVDENIRAAFAGDETVTLAAVEPFDRTDDTFRHFLPPKQKRKRNYLEQYVFYRPVNKKRFKGSALSRRLVSSNENLLASYLITIPERWVGVKIQEKDQV
jgi:hypothetical protein